MQKIEVNTNKAGPISFDAKRNENMNQKKKDFKNYMSQMKKGKDNDGSFMSGTSKSQVNKGDSFDGSVEDKSMSDTARSKSVGKPRVTAESFGLGASKTGSGQKASNNKNEDRSPSRQSKSSGNGTPK